MGAEVLPVKKQVAVERLRRRFEGYRKHQTDCIPRFNQSFNGLAEQNIQETLVLRQRYLESKAKRAQKKTDKKQSDPQALGPGPPPQGPQQPHGKESYTTSIVEESSASVEASVALGSTARPAAGAAAAAPVSARSNRKLGYQGRNTGA
ncbi:Neurogenic protein mastermind [Frankliniella fusca]|uniref:Neurogenic protein mastermind n=1 Tax=Frankliniella fusca TaxID=407009 RepID=A0AAE1LK63_9NEOP|nr:Neurogenic protein mastermind [Frankliniella fusca]